MKEHVVPDKAAGGERQRVITAERITANEPAERFLKIINGHAFGHPRVPVGGDHAVAVEVVEQHELLGQRMQVGRRLAPEDAELRIAVPPADVAKDLVVGAVLFDDVDNMLEN